MKRFLSIALTFVLLIGLMPVMSTPAQAAGLVSVVGNRDDGTWLFPVSTAYWNSFSDWAGCPGTGKCGFHNRTHNSDPENWGDTLHTFQASTGGHNGIDIKADFNSSVMAAAPGYVVFTGTMDGRGNTLIMEHPIGSTGQSYYSYYQHLNSYKESVRKPKKPIEAGTIIATVGNTGPANTQTHLHFGIVIGPSNDNIASNLGYYEKQGWATKAGETQKRILNNPSTSQTNFPTTSDFGGDVIAPLKAHCGSVTYTFDTAKVSIGSGSTVCTSHTRGTYKYFEANHPHHSCYMCGICGVIWADRSTSNYYESCVTCTGAGKTSKPSVSVGQASVSVEWTYSGNTTGFTVYLIQDPWGWDDIKYSRTVSPSTRGCTFTDVSSGTYKAFVIAWPNEATQQSTWSDAFTVESPSPGKPILLGVEPLFTVDDYITFDWELTEKTDQYNLFIEKLSGDDYILFQSDYNVYRNYWVDLAAGDYRIKLQSVNTGYTDPSTGEAICTDGDWEYFSVVEAPIRVAGIDVSPGALTIGIGDTYCFEVTVFPEDAYDPSHTWKSSNPAVAEVDSLGYVTGKAAGTAVITATTEDGGYADSCTVTVSSSSSISVTGLMFGSDSETIELGQALSYPAVVLPFDATNTACTWSSSNTTVATVRPNDNDSSRCNIIGVGIGSCVITAQTVDGGYTANLNLIVKQGSVPVTGITIVPDGLTLFTGESFSPGVVITPDNASCKECFWSSSDSNVATVSDDGCIKAISDGKAIITATTMDGGLISTCEVTVIGPNVPATGISLNHSSTSIGVGKQFTLNARISPNNASNKNCIWNSSNQSVATVDPRSGDIVTVTGVSEGSAEITVTALGGDNLTATCTVTVTDDGGNVPVTGISLKWVSAHMDVLSVINPEATVLPENATNKACTWESSDPTVATVDNEGNITCVGEGSATITVTTVDGGHTATFPVTVFPIQHPVTGVSLEYDKVTVPNLQVGNLRATVYPDDASHPECIWSSSDPSVASVDDAGYITGHQAGTTVITVTTVDGGFTDNCIVTLGKASQDSKNEYELDINVSVVNNESTAVATFMNNTQTDTKCILLLAGYDNVGTRLAEIKVVGPLIVSANSTSSISHTFPLTGRTVTFKAFSFSPDTQAPLTDAARWGDYFMVWFDSTGGGCNTSGSVEINGLKYDALPVPEREGYIFDGWYTSAIGGTRITTDTTVNLSDDQTIYAHWVKET